MGVLTELYEATVKPDEHGALTLHYAAKASIVEMVEMLFDRHENKPEKNPITLTYLEGGG